MPTKGVCGIEVNALAFMPEVQWCECHRQELKMDSLQCSVRSLLNYVHTCSHTYSS